MPGTATERQAGHGLRLRATVPVTVTAQDRHWQGAAERQAGHGPPLRDAAPAHGPPGTRTGRTSRRRRARMTAGGGGAGADGGVP